MTATPLIDGESEISGFGNATRITIVDETSYSFKGNLTDGSATITGLSSTTGLAAGLVVTGTGIPSGTTIESVDAGAGTIVLSNAATVSGLATSLTARDQTFGQVIGGFDPSNVAGTNIAANWTNSVGDFSIPINSGVFTSNGLKMVEVFATDDAGSVGNTVMLSFTLDVAGISPPSAPVTPTLSLITSTPGYTNNPTPELTGTTSPLANVELFLLIGGVPTPFSPLVTTQADALGNFNFTFPDMTGGMDGTFGPYSVVAQASNSIGSSGFSTPPVTFTIIVGAPAAPTNFSLTLASDTGIVGDDITADRTPVFTGDTVPGATVELFEEGSSTVYQTVTANSSGVFDISLPFVLTNGSISLYVEAIDQAGNQSSSSNPLTVQIVSVASDYNGDSFSDAALYDRGSVTFTGTLTSGSPVVTNLSTLSGLVIGVGITGTGIPIRNDDQCRQYHHFTSARRLTGSALVTGIPSTSGLFTGENITGTGIPAGATIVSITSSTAITLSVNATATGSPTLTATAITLSANATVSGAKSLTANPGLWLVQATSGARRIPLPSGSPPARPTARRTSLRSRATSTATASPTWRTTRPAPSTWFMFDSKSGSMTSFKMTGTNATTLPVAGYFDAQRTRRARDVHDRQRPGRVADRQRHQRA